MVDPYQLESVMPMEMLPNDKAILKCSTSCELLEAGMGYYTIFWLLDASLVVILASYYWTRHFISDYSSAVFTGLIANTEMGEILGGQMQNNISKSCFGF